MYELDCEALMKSVNTASSIIDRAYRIIYPIPRNANEYKEWSRHWTRFHESKVYSGLNLHVNSLSGLTSRYPRHSEEADKVFDAVYDAVFHKDIKNFDFEIRKKAFMQEHEEEIQDFVKYVLKTGNFIIPVSYIEACGGSQYNQLYKHQNTVDEQLKILKLEVSHIDGTRELIERINYIDNLIRTIRSESASIILWA